MKVTALKTFVGKAGLIKAGTRFETDELHAKQLERNGLVSRHEIKPAPPVLTKAEQEAQAKAEQEAQAKAEQEAQAKADKGKAAK
ncbi:hypothetical protein [Vreelandella alkaliphila]|uniref:hypothetical protein n=1 Tax=Vreelandella alkaliphila TaxID=272774 RepID=UPI00138F35F1|nr:hypothetical protein [Halomonas alkaliphila]